jgi:hypothetical protein
MLDTDVLSDLMSAPRLTRRRKIEAWLRSLDGEAVVLSSVSTAEINRGVALVKDCLIAASIRNGLDQIISIYGDAILTPSHEEWQTFARRLFRSCGVFATARTRRICRELAPTSSSPSKPSQSDAPLPPATRMILPLLTVIFQSSVEL